MTSSDLDRSYRRWKLLQGQYVEQYSTHITDNANDDDQLQSHASHSLPGISTAVFELRDQGQGQGHS